MSIQGSINNLLSQAQRLATLYVGYGKAKDVITGQENIVKGQQEIVKGQEEQTAATKSLQETFESRYRSKLDIPADAKLRPSQREKIEIGTKLEQELGRPVSLATVDNVYMRNKEAKFKNMMAQNMAKAEVDAREDSINQSKKGFDEHIASLIRYYGKGSGNP